MKKAVEQIRKAVREEASAESARILQEARAEVDRLLEDSQKAEEETGRARREGERTRREQENAREIARARQSSRLALLDARNKIIDEVFAQVRREVLHLPQERYRKVLRAWLAEIEPASGGEIIAAPRDASMLEALVKEANGGRGAESQLVISKEKAPFESGFVFRTPRYEVKKSLDSWIEEQKREMSPQIERELFGEGLDSHGD